MGLREKLMGSVWSVVYMGRYNMLHSALFTPTPSNVYVMLYSVSKLKLLAQSTLNIYGLVLLSHAWNKY
jgi:hypothetical protein